MLLFGFGGRTDLVEQILKIMAGKKHDPSVSLPISENNVVNSFAF